jgi:signal transduction histidine kinase/ActR/RegA family two-component response regulator
MANIPSQIALENIIAFMPGHVYWKDLNGVYIGCNDKQALSLGFQSAKDVIGKTDYELPWSIESADEFRKNDLQVMRNATPITKKEKIIIGSKEAILITQKIPLFDDNQQVIGVLGISTDITDLMMRAKKKAEIANEAKTEFIANMSHDLKTPMTGLLGMLRGLLQSEQEARSSLNSKSQLSQEKLEKILSHVLDQVKEYASLALISGERLNQFHDDVLNNVELDSGQSTEIRTDFNLDHLIQDVIGLQKPAAFNKKLNLTAEIEEHTPCHLNGLKQSFYRVLANLISNAIKFTQEGSISVNVSLNESKASGTCHEGDEIRLKVSVSDTGMGIPQDKFDEIFNPFSRLTSSYNGIYEGLGIGLYAVKQYVTHMKGEIRVESQIGQGSCFTVYLPFQVQDDGETQFVEAQKKQEEARLKESERLKQESLRDSEARNKAKLAVLLVEDDKIAGKVASMSLMGLGCSVEMAESGEEAIEKLKQKDYALIFMDIGLPGMTGIETAVAIRRLKDVTKSNTPIVALTGHAYGKSRQLCLNAGMQSVCSKPATPEDLRKALDYFSAS